MVEHSTQNPKMVGSNKDTGKKSSLAKFTHTAVNFRWLHDTQHNSTLDNYIQHNGTLHKGPICEIQDK